MVECSVCGATDGTFHYSSGKVLCFDTVECDRNRALRYPVKERVTNEGGKKSMKLDGKFHGVVVKNKDQSIVPQDQWMVFLAKDNAVPATLRFYYEECARQGAAPEQLAAVSEMIARVDEWRKRNPDKLKTPDVAPGRSFDAQEGRAFQRAHLHAARSC